MKLTLPEYSLALNAIGDCVMLVDAQNYRVLDVTPKCLALLGLERDSVVGRTCYEATHGRSTPCVPPCDPCPLSAAVRTKRRVSVTHLHLTAGGGHKYVEITALPLTDASGAVKKILHVSTDVTEIRLLHEELCHARKLEAVGKALAGIAHDLNNTIGAIGGFAALLLKALPGGSPLREDLLEIQTAQGKAAAIIKELLSVSRKHPPQKKLVSPNSMVTGLEKLLKTLLGPEIGLKLVLSPAAPEIYADAAHLEQALINLALNAKKAMPSGGRLTISTFAEEGPARAPGSNEPVFYPARLCGVLVEDTGRGIPEEELKHIFEPFFTSGAESGGTGLGLANVFSVVSDHQGRIRVSSAVGEGTAFRITIPAAGGVQL